MSDVMRRKFSRAQLAARERDADTKLSFDSGVAASMIVTSGTGAGAERDIMMTIEPNHNNTAFLPCGTSTLIDLSVRELAVRMPQLKPGS